MAVLHGTKPVPQDHRNFSFNRTFGATVTLPDEYNVDAGFGCPDQNADGLPYGCTGYTQSELCQDEDTEQYKPPYTYDRTLFMEGEEGQQVGCSITDSLKSLIVYGPQGTSETTDQQAAAHRRGQYFQVEPVGTDFFDAIRQALYFNADEKRAVSIGTPWFHEWENPLGGIVSDFIFTGQEPWHNWKISGWKNIGGQPYLIGKSWQGPNYGDRGFHYVSREICNKMMALAGTAAFTVRKATAADIQTVQLDLWSTVLSYLRMWLDSLLSVGLPNGPVGPQTASTTPNSTVPVPVPSTVPESVPPAANADPDSIAYPWDTPKHNWHNVRVQCDEKGLSLDDKNLICACIYQESRFDNAAKNENKDAQGNVLSTDWGICQINDYYHIGAGKDFPSVQFLLNSPDLAVDFMIDMFKAGKLDQWVSYSSGAYEKWLVPSSPMWALAA